MRIKRQVYGFRNNSNRAGVVLLLFVWIFMASGCAGTKKTTTTQTTVTSPNEAVVYEDTQEATTVGSTTTTTETEAGRPGVLSSTLHAVGYVISLPFIIIGGLFRIIFGG